MNIFLKFAGKIYPRSYNHLTFTLQGSKFNIKKSVNLPHLQMKEENYMSISIDAQEVQFNKIKHLFVAKKKKILTN